MEMFYPVDLVMNNGDEPRLPVGEVTELWTVYNVNLNDSEMVELWFEEEQYGESLPILTEAEMLALEMEF